MHRRWTTQKKLVLEYLHSVRTHPTAEEVFIPLKSKLPSLTLATVYRNLHLLAEEGMIKHLKINSEYHFDGFTGSHHHLVCGKCGRIQDLESKEMTAFLSRQLIVEDFHPEAIRVEGTCSRCN